MFRFHTVTRQILHRSRKPTINEVFRFHTLIRQTLDQKRMPTINEWHELREKLLLNGSHNWEINRLILNSCFPDKLDTGKSYIDYLKESKQKLSTGTWVRILQMYYNASKCGIRITAKQQQDIIDMFEYLYARHTVTSDRSGKHSSFSRKLCAAIVEGLVLTADWRKSLDVLDATKDPLLHRCYAAIVQRAIQENDEHLVWTLFDQITAKRICPNNELLTFYVGHCERNVTTFRKNIGKILTSIGDNRILVSAEVANEFQRAFHRFDYSCNITTVSKRGECHSCGKRLHSPAKLTDDEFKHLRSHFWNNIFTKSTPKEMESFRPFIDGTRTYDIVIDGLNIGSAKYMVETDVRYGNENAFDANRMTMESELISWNRMRSLQLANVVKYFADRQKAVLVIGREHMKEWPKAQMDYVSENADLFLTENSSEDDEFSIYAALKSGPHTDIVTRDVLQNHANKLDGELRTVFRRWQQQHQYNVMVIGDCGIVTIEDRIEFDMNAHEVDDGCWHIPFEDGDRCRFQQTFCKLWKNWMCVSKN